MGAWGQLLKTSFFSRMSEARWGPHACLCTSSLSPHPGSHLGCLHASVAFPLPLTPPHSTLCAGEVLEVVSSGDVWKEKWVEEAVMRYLARKAAGGTPPI